MEGKARSRWLRARHSLRTSPNSYDSRYLRPPQARLDEACDVTEAKSPRSMSATRAPRAASAAAETAPLMPPPSTNTSNSTRSNLPRLVSRSSFIAAKILRLLPEAPACSVSPSPPTPTPNQNENHKRKPQTKTRTSNEQRERFSFWFFVFVDGFRFGFRWVQPRASLRLALRLQCLGWRLS